MFPLYLSLSLTINSSRSSSVFLLGLAAPARAASRVFFMDVMAVTTST